MNTNERNCDRWYKGSLSISIVLFESWETDPKKPVIREGGYQISGFVIRKHNKYNRDMSIMLTKQLQIAERSKRYAKEGLTNLHNCIDELWLYESFKSLRKQSSSGIDGEDYEGLQKRLIRRMPNLLREFKSGSYQAPPVKRVYIPKGQNEQRPIGIPTLEDKLLQNAVRSVLDPVYEGAFYEHSYGFRKGRSAHQALEQLWQSCMDIKVGYILDADIKNYFGSINHGKLRDVLDQRVKDGVLRRQIDKWLKAGVMEEDQLVKSMEGSPQGGVVTPLTQKVTF